MKSEHSDSCHFVCDAQPTSSIVRASIIIIFQTKFSNSASVIVALA